MITDIYDKVKTMTCAVDLHIYVRSISFEVIRKRLFSWVCSDEFIIGDYVTSTKVYQDKFAP